MYQTADIASEFLTSDIKKIADNVERLLRAAEKATRAIKTLPGAIDERNVEDTDAKLTKIEKTLLAEIKGIEEGLHKIAAQRFPRLSK